LSLAIEGWVYGLGPLHLSVESWVLSVIRWIKQHLDDGNMIIDYHMKAHCV